MIGRSELQLPDSVHASRPWRIHEILPDFELQDVWALPTPGGPGDFSRLLDLMASGDPSKFSSAPARALFAIRWKLGELLGWDDPDDGLGSRVPSLRGRLPEDLRDGPPLPQFDTLPFESLYLTENEWAGEIANKTVHGVMHLGWVSDPEAPGGFRGEMAVCVKANGLFGRAYMAAIDPFRHYVVYPSMLRQISSRWSRRERVSGSRTARNPGRACP